MKIYFNKLNEDAIIPQYAHEDDAGLDFYSFEDTYIGAGETVIVKTGLRCMFENKYVMIMNMFQVVSSLYMRGNMDDKRKVL